ncbi:MAG TPA: hypothetical protein VFL13_15530 [Candidatus Baltobacteraceae bacterium]|nr:hypothetical protein [Candidatus Baltobacteraceae bacterium]
MRIPVISLSLCLLVAACGGGGSSTAVTPQAPNAGAPAMTLPKGGGAPVAGCPSGTFIVASNTFESLHDSYTGAVLHIYGEQSGNAIGTVQIDSMPNIVIGNAVMTTNATMAYVFQWNTPVDDFKSTAPQPALTIVDLGTQTITHQITFAGNLYWGILSNDQTKLYAAGYDASGFALFTFSAADGSQLGRIPLPAGSVFPYRVTLNPAGTEAYVLDVNAKQIDAVNLVTNTSSVFYHLDPNQAQDNLAMNAAGTKLFMTQYYNTLVLDPNSAAVLGTIAPPATSENFDMNASWDRSTMFLVGPPLVGGSSDNEADVIPTTGSSITSMWNSGSFGDRSTVNTNGRFGLLWLPQFQSIDITAWQLPSGQGAYYVPTANNEVVYGVAAQ